MLAESFLVGPRHGLLRWKELQAENAASAKEKWFFLAEFAVALLLNGHSMPFDEIPIPKPDIAMPFETSVIKLFFHNHVPPSEEKLAPPWPFTRL